MLVQAELEVGPGGVAGSDNTGLWFLDGPGDMVLRTGSGDVPGVASANFLDVTNVALNDSGQVAVAASLEIGPGGVDSSNDTGLWLMDPTGSSQLIAREGDALAGKTIASLDFLAGSGSSDSQAIGLNNSAQFLFTASFTDGDSGLFLYNLLEADFDNNTMVNSADFQDWESGFGIDTGATRSQGDADGDMDVDGFDLLTWQRQFGIGVPPPAIAIAVPEPSTQLLLLSAALLLPAIRHQRRCPSRSYS